MKAKKQRGRKRRGNVKVPRTAEQLVARTEPFQNSWNRTVGVISKMRADGLSLNRASNDAGINPHTVVRLAGRALRKGDNGRYTASKRDSLLRVLEVPTSDGLQEVALRDSRQASKLAQYWAAVHWYLQTGDASRLETYKDQAIKDSDGVAVPLLTDLRELNRLGSAGVLSFESLYARAA